MRAAQGEQGREAARLDGKTRSLLMAPAIGRQGAPEGEQRLLLGAQLPLSLGEAELGDRQLAPVPLRRPPISRLSERFSGGRGLLSRQQEQPALDRIAPAGRGRGRGHPLEPGQRVIERTRQPRTGRQPKRCVLDDKRLSGRRGQLEGLVKARGGRAELIGIDEQVGLTEQHPGLVAPQAGLPGRLEGLLIESVRLIQVAGQVVTVGRIVERHDEIMGMAVAAGDCQGPVPVIETLVVLMQTKGNGAEVGQHPALVLQVTLLLVQLEGLPQVCVSLAHLSLFLQTKAEDPQGIGLHRPVGIRLLDRPQGRHRLLDLVLSIPDKAALKPDFGEHREPGRATFDGIEHRQRAGDVPAGKPGLGNLDLQPGCDGTLLAQPCMPVQEGRIAAAVKEIESQRVHERGRLCEFAGLQIETNRLLPVTVLRIQPRRFAPQEGQPAGVPAGQLSEEELVKEGMIAEP